MYLKQRGLKISGSMADFTKRVVSHARGNASRDVLEDEEFNNSCEDDTISESESSDSMERTHTLKSHLKQIRYKGTNAGRKQGRGGGVDLNIISR